MLPQDFEKIYAPFAFTITGGTPEECEELEVNGEHFMYADFEE